MIMVCHNLNPNDAVRRGLRREPRAPRNRQAAENVLHDLGVHVHGLQSDSQAMGRVGENVACVRDPDGRRP